MPLAQIIYLPNGRWKLVVADEESETADYLQRIIACLGDYWFAAQTCYYGEEAVWLIQKQIEHASLDRSLGE